ncbi:MarR family transcriptional regulator [Advenella faeciporci]|uniref:MarR family transcriptional regulator n=1 Tax=Advenella faeciporci TaxID=797535 RepID=A0A918JE93_9BURK|nr:MarR family transcriptional regulator [Advenella faeciporci]NLY34784.1 MarR family transcriptional regulator [Alcaligenaceae bacterium]GGW76412.1 MarR family transcriptional regulator [Advenella faeciporci]
MNSKKISLSQPEKAFTIKPEDVPRGQENIGYLIRLVHFSIHDMIEKNMAPLGLTATQWHPIAIIGLSKADTPACVARIAEVDTGAMTRTLDRLEAKGFLTRQRSEQDRRVIKLTLTEKGKQVNEKLLPSVAQALNHHLQGFTEQEVELLKSLLTRMLLNANPNILKSIQENGMNG